MPKGENYETSTGKIVYKPKFFYSEYTTKTGKQTTHYYLASTIKSKEDDAIPFVRIGKDDVKKISKLYGEPEFKEPNEKKKRKTCEERYEECLEKRKPKRKASSDSEDETPKKRKPRKPVKKPSPMSGSESESEEEKPKKKPAKRAAKRPAKKPSKKPSKTVKKKKSSK